MDDKFKFLTEQVRQLVLQMTPPQNQKDEQMIQKYVSYFMRILSSRIASSIPDDEGQLKEQVNKQIQKIYGANDKGTNTLQYKCQELLQRLGRSRTLQQRSSVLTLLLKLSGNEKQLGTDKSPNIDSIFKPKTALNKTTQAISQNNNNSMDCEQTVIPVQGYQNQSFSGSTGYGASTMNVTSQTIKKNEENQALMLAIKKISDKGNPQVDLTENELLKDLLFAFQGIDGHYIAFSKQDDCFLLKENVPVSEPVRSMINKMCEIGWLFKKVLDHISREPVGLINQSLFAAIQEELIEYYRLIAILENLRSQGQNNYQYSTQQQQQQQQLSNRGAQQSINQTQIMQQQMRSQSEGNPSENLSFRKLMLWTIEPFERIKWLAVLCDAVKNLQGCNIISVVKSYQQQGNPQIQALITRILSATVQPFTKFVNLWVFCGELNDPLGEFFISEDVHVNDVDQLWNSKYKFIAQQIPTIIDRSIAEKIFNIGKSVNFMRRCCTVTDWQLNLAQFTPVTTIHSSSNDNVMQQEGINQTPNNNNSFVSLASPSSVTNSSLNAFSQWIGQASVLTNEKLVSVLQSKFQLKSHLEAIKKYLLMGQGEFIQCLMDLMNTELNKPANNIYRHNLLSLLETAIRSSNVQFQQSDISNRLDVKLLEPSPGDKGWDIFSLDYHVESPISTILNTATMKQYLKIFNFLWRVKRVEYNLNAVWMAHIKNNRLMSNFRQMKNEFLKCNLLRSEMSHFVTNFFSYIMVEAIESAWNNFMEQIQTAADFSQLIQVHEKFVQDVLDKALLTQKNDQINRQLIKIFDMIFRFKFTQDIIITDTAEEYERLKQSRQNKEMMNILKSGKDTTSDKQQSIQHEGEDDEDGNNDFNDDEEDSASAAKEDLISKDSLKHFYTIAKDYRQAFKEFQTMLKKDEKLRFLSFRLDFNEFYLNKRNQVDLEEIKILNNMGMGLDSKNYMFYDKQALQQQQQQQKVPIAPSDSKSDKLNQNSFFSQQAPLTNNSVNNSFNQGPNNNSKAQASFFVNKNQQQQSRDNSSNKPPQQQLPSTSFQQSQQQNYLINQQKIDLDKPKMQNFFKEEKKQMTGTLTMQEEINKKPMSFGLTGYSALNKQPVLPNQASGNIIKPKIEDRMIDERPHIQPQTLKQEIDNEDFIPSNINVASSSLQNMLYQQQQQYQQQHNKIIQNQQLLGANQNDRDQEEGEDEGEDNNAQNQFYDEDNDQGN